MDLVISYPAHGVFRKAAFFVSDEMKIGFGWVWLGLMR